MSDYITIGKAAEMLGVTPQTLRNWEKNGELVPNHKTESGLRCYTEEQILGFLKLKSTKGKSNGSVVLYCSDVDTAASERARTFMCAKGVSYVLKSGEEGLKSLVENILEYKIKELYVPDNRALNLEEKWWLAKMIDSFKVNLHVIEQ